MNSAIIQSPRNFSNRISPIKNIDDLVDKNNIAAIEFNNHIHKVCHLLDCHNHDNNFSTVQAYIDLDYLFKLHDSKESMIEELEETWCGYYDDDKNLCEDWFILVLHRMMKERKTIFVFLDLHNYFISKKENPKYWERGDHESVNHSVSILLYPKGENEYNMYYFNSHGSMQLTEMSYSLYVTKKRTKEISLPVHMDGFIIKMFAEMFNSKIADYLEEDCHPVHINYDLSKRHNYYGINLQCIDDWGICYIFPFILCYELKINFTNSNYFTEENVLNLRSKKAGKRRFTSYKSYMRNDDVEQIIMISISKYIPEIKEMFLKYKRNPYANPLLSKRLVSKKHIHKYSEVFEYENIFYENVENLLKYKGSQIIHNIYSQVVHYVTQPELLESCNKF